MKALVVLNSRAGSLNGNQANAFSFETARAILERNGITAELEKPSAQGILDTLRAAVSQRPDALIVGGGDGTISAAAGVLANTNIALGILPLGTLNHFARDLHVPDDWKTAAEKITDTHSSFVDVAEVNSRVFINNCSLGSYAEAVRRRDGLRRTKGHHKMFAMLLASFAVFRDLRRMSADVRLPTATLRIRTPLIVISNNRYSGHLLATRLRPRLDAGELCFYATRTSRRTAFLRLVWQALVRRLDEADALEVHTATEVLVATNDAVPIAADGELLDLKSPYHFRLRPRALRVLGAKTIA
jgi:diacylglycerol kinase family enzyme